MITKRRFFIESARNIPYVIGLLVNGTNKRQLSGHLICTRKENDLPNEGPQYSSFCHL